LADKLDIFETLTALDRRDFSYLERLDEDARKGFTPVVALRWLSAIGDGPEQDLMLPLVNEIANVNFFDLFDHPELQYKLMAACGLGRKLRHQWIGMAKQQSAPDKLYACLAKFWPDANNTEMKIILSQFTRDTFEEFLLEGGCETNEVPTILASYDRYHGLTPAPKAKGKKKKA
jgi:hypothetical protein